MVQRQRSDGQHADAIFADKKRKFIRAVQRAAILHHAQMARGDLIVHAMVKQDDAVGNIFFQPVTRE